MAKTKSAPPRPAAKDVIQTTTSFKQLGTLIRRAVRAGCRPILYGRPGVGKTQGIAALCRREKWGRFETLIGSQCSPEDITGFPIEGPPTRDAVGNLVPQTVFAVRDMFHRLNEHGGILFLDEFLCTPISVMAPILRLLAEGVAADFALDLTRVGIIAATNSADIAVNGSDLPAAMANRLVHLGFPEGAEAVREWCQDFPGYWGAPPRVSFFGEALPEPEYMRARAYVAGFLSIRTSLWIDMPSDPAGQAGPWPSPRTWDAAARLIARTVADKAPAVEAVDLVAGAIGGGPGVEFLEYMRQQDLPDPEGLLADPKRYRPSPDRPDVDHAVLSSIAEAVRGRYTHERFKTALFIVGERCVKSGQSPESAVGAFSTLGAIWEQRHARHEDVPDDVHHALLLYASAFGPLQDLILRVK